MTSSINKKTTGITKKKLSKSKSEKPTSATSPRSSISSEIEITNKSDKLLDTDIKVETALNKISRKKNVNKPAAKSLSKSKLKSKELRQIEKSSKIEIKAAKKAAGKAREIEKKAIKASEKAREMARSKSKKREKEHAKIKYQRHMKLEEAVTYFTSLIAGLEKGTVQFKQGKDTLVLNPSDLVEVEIKAETKGRDEKVTFELSWHTDNVQDISISSS